MKERELLAVIAAPIFALRYQDWARRGEVFKQSELSDLCKQSVDEAKLLLRWTQAKKVSSVK